MKLLHSSFGLESLDSLPGEVRIVTTKMTVSSSLLVPVVATPLEVKVDSHHPRPKVEVLLDKDKDFLIRDGSSLVCVHENRKWLSHTNSI
ncbi:hypothetical protein SSX86_018586 [Deinandra increscens subsp. villosa]|uniref:Uncharacterized protein n=1 Tax=Deinandra increscens subsp. villosa TaxID=3103831 RepID=A0AAP0CR09_9ASTR